MEQAIENYFNKLCCNDNDITFLGVNENLLNSFTLCDLDSTTFNTYAEFDFVGTGVTVNNTNSDSRIDINIIGNHIKIGNNSFINSSSIILFDIVFSNGTITKTINIELNFMNCQ